MTAFRRVRHENLTDRPPGNDHLRILFQRPVGRGVRQAVHLPPVPRDNVSYRFALVRVGKMFPAFGKMLRERHEGVDPRYEQAVALKLVAVARLERPRRPFQPVRFGVGVLADGAEFAVKQSHALPDGNGRSGRRVVAACQKRPLAAGDFHARGLDVGRPCAVFRESDAPCRRVNAVESVLTPEPNRVKVVAHRPAYPQRRVHLSPPPRPRRLLFGGFLRPRLDDSGVFVACNQVRRDFGVRRVSRPAFGVGVGRPQDVPARGLIRKERFQYAQRVQTGDFVPNIDDFRHCPSSPHRANGFAGWRTRMYSF